MSSPQGQPAAAAPSKKSGAKWLALVAGALLLAGGGVVAFQRKAATDKPAGVETKPVPLDPGVVEFEPFILNLADPVEDRYFRLDLRLVLDQRVIAERAASGLSQARLRDRILSILSKKRAGEMTTVEGRENLRAELLAASEALLAQPPLHAEGDPAPARVIDVYFMEFLVQ